MEINTSNCFSIRKKELESVHRYALEKTNILCIKMEGCHNQKDEMFN